jgi:hypothetical protein
MTGPFRYAALVGLIVLGGCLPALAQAAKPSVAGVWKGAMDTQMGAVETTITIDGVAPLAGTVQLADYTGTIENGALDGDKISFATTVQPGTITFEGTVSGDEMRLNVTGTTGNKMTLVARRQKSVRVQGGLLDGVPGRDPAIAASPAKQAFWETFLARPRPASSQ